MKKDLLKKNDGLMIYFTKKECKLEGYEEGDIVDLSDMIVKRGKNE